jgi:hypothetical protein
MAGHNGAQQAAFPAAFAGAGEISTSPCTLVRPPQVGILRDGSLARELTQQTLVAADLETVYLEQMGTGRQSKALS